MRRGRTDAFTLIEMLAVLFLTAVVMGVALNFYVDLSDQSARATETTRDVRRATSLLDRVAHDFERAILVSKPDDVDPLAHPWVFLAESRLLDGGADRVKFVTRRSPEGRFDAPRSDVSLVTYQLRASEDEIGGYTLIRSVSPLPPQLDRDFPLDGDDGGVPLAEGIRHFHLRFLAEDGEWVSEWDSSQLLDTSELPVAVEIDVALASNEATENEPAEFDTLAEPQSYTRRVLLPLRPFDLAALFDPTAGDENAEGGDEDADDPSGGRTVAECINPNALGGNAGKSAGLSGIQGMTREQLESLAQAPFADIADLYCGDPAVRPECC